MRSPIVNQKSTEIIQDNNNNNGNNNNCNNFEEITTNCKKYAEKYSLRQRQKRITGTATLKGTSSSPKMETDHLQQKRSLVKEKVKSKAAPLSKYRRKTANARERTRMREINSAFENLRKCVPLSLNNDEQNLTNEKLTKITTLRLAMKYIKSLTEALNNPSHDINYLISQKQNNFYDKNFSDSFEGIYNDEDDDEDRDDDEDDVEINSTKFNNKPSNGINRTRGISSCSSSGKLQNHRNKQKQKPKFFDTVNTNNTQSSFGSIINGNQSELGMFLESDGESLHLSEPCLSPLSHSVKSFSNVSPLSIGEDQLSLNLLFESDSESLEFSEPSCLSPLETLDSLNPFPDLLQTEFSDQTSFDMYLT